MKPAMTFSRQPLRNHPGAYARIEIIIILLVLAVLVGVFVPRLVKARRTAQANSCANNMRMLDGAKFSWSMENKKGADDLPTRDELAGTDKYMKTWPICPAGGTYSLRPVRNRPTCSIPGHTLTDREPRWQGRWGNQ